MIHKIAIGVVNQRDESYLGITYPVVQISVTNMGVEIPIAALSRIFEPFYRVPKSDRWQQGGTGLDLALVQRFVEHLGGTIQVASAMNRSQFTVELPQTLAVE